MKVFLDTNVILEYFTVREEYVTVQRLFERLHRDGDDLYNAVYGHLLRTLLLLVMMTGGVARMWGKDNIKPADSKASGCSETWLRVKTEALPSITGAKVDILFETTK